MHGVPLNRECGQTFLQKEDLVDFDAVAVTERLKAEAKALSKARRKPHTYAQRKSVLDVHTYELLRLDQAGCSCANLKTWLAENGITVERSTIHRWLHRNRQNG